MFPKYSKLFVLSLYNLIILSDIWWTYTISSYTIYWPFTSISMPSRIILTVPTENRFTAKRFRPNIQLILTPARASCCEGMGFYSWNSYTSIPVLVFLTGSMNFKMGYKLKWMIAFYTLSVKEMSITEGVFYSTGLTKVEYVLKICNRLE